MADNFNDIIAQQTPTFGNRGPGIYGIKFVDTNADGIRQPGETQTQAGVTFILEPAATADGIYNPPTATTVDARKEAVFTTQSDGAFQFLNVAVGTYRLTELVPLGAFATTPGATLLPAGASVTTNGRQAYINVTVDKTDVTNLLFGNSTTPRSGIVGCKYLDFDGDGFRDGNEPGIKNVRIFLDGTNGNPIDGVFQPGELNTLTNKDGEWNIPVSAGTYRVREERVSGTGPLETNFLQSTPPNNVPLLDVTVAPGQTFYCAQIGNAPLYQIPIEKFQDVNGNGKRDSLEPGLADVPFILDLNKDGKWQQGQEPILTTGRGTTASESVLSNESYWYPRQPEFPHRQHS
jgi:serine-aspartate repeat-containing protein C/D/E